MNSSRPFDKETVVVTGASGFIGSHLCQRLRSSAVEVHGVSRASHSPNGNAARWWQADLADMGQARQLLGNLKPTLIFHLAGLPIGKRDLEFVLPTFQSNLVTTVNVLTAATESGCRRIVLAGSSEEPEIGLLDPIPSSPYATAKWAARSFARMYHLLYGTPVVIARIFMTYGPGSESAHKLIPYTINALLREEAPRLTSGQRLIDWIYIDDVVDGLLAAGSAPNVEGCTIDLGSGRLVSIRELVQQIVGLIRPAIKPFFEALPDRPLEQARVADTASALEKLGWRATTPLEQGLRLTVDWFRRNPTQVNAE